jgi:hypothetical protein
LRNGASRWYAPVLLKSGPYTLVSLMSCPAINSSGSLSPATVNVFENTLLVLSFNIVMLYVVGVDWSNGTVNGVSLVMF